METSGGLSGCSSHGEFYENLTSVAIGEMLGTSTGNAVTLETNLLLNKIK
jgi:hypothetical protein